VADQRASHIRSCTKGRARSEFAFDREETVSTGDPGRAQAEALVNLLTNGALDRVDQRGKRARKLYQWGLHPHHAEPGSPLAGDNAAFEEGLSARLVRRCRGHRGGAVPDDERLGEPEQLAQLADPHHAARQGDAH